MIERTFAAEIPANERGEDDLLLEASGGHGIVLFGGDEDMVYIGATQIGQVIRMLLRWYITQAVVGM